MCGWASIGSRPRRRKPRDASQATESGLRSGTETRSSPSTSTPRGFPNHAFLDETTEELTGWQADREGRYFLAFHKNGRLRKWSPSGDIPPVDYRVPVGATSVGDYCDGGFLSTARALDLHPHGVNVWRLDDSGLNLLRSFDELNFDYYGFDRVGLRLAMRGPLPFHRLWELGKPAATRPLSLRSGPAAYAHRPGFSPDGRWLVTNDTSGLKMWPLDRDYPSVIEVDFKPWSNGIAFGPEGRFLATSAGSEVRAWPLDGPVPSGDFTVFETEGSADDVNVSPDGELFMVGYGGPGVWIGKAGEEPRQLHVEDLLNATWSISFSPDGRLVAANDGGYDIANAALHVWDIATGAEVAVLRPEEGQLRYGPGFASDGRLLLGTTAGVIAWNVETDHREKLVEALVLDAVSSQSGRRLVVVRAEDEDSRDPAGYPSFYDLDNGEVTDLRTHGLQVTAMALDREGTVVVTGDENGLIRVGPVTGGEPHLLIGHDKKVFDLEVDPLGRWIASASMDGTMRLWPMPDLSKPPLHTLPREELIAKLKTLTNLRVVRDPESSTGWTLTHDPFPGWETVPTW